MGSGYRKTSGGGPLDTICACLVAPSASWLAMNRSPLPYNFISMMFCPGTKWPWLEPSDTEKPAFGQWHKSKPVEPESRSTSPPVSWAHTACWGSHSLSQWKQGDTFGAGRWKNLCPPWLETFDYKISPRIASLWPTSKVGTRVGPSPSLWIWCNRLSQAPDAVFTVSKITPSSQRCFLSRYFFF